MKITPSMVTLWHVAATITGGIMVPILLGLAQYVSSHGANVGQDVSYGIPVLVGGLATLPVSIWHAVKANPALPQAEKDVEAQATPIVTTAIGQVGAFVKEEINALESRLHIHINNAVQAATPVSVPQVAFPTNLSVGSILPLTPNATSAPNLVMPSRSFTQSALMPAVPKQ